jgi:hypothetical protein
MFLHAKLFQCEQILRYLETLQCFSALTIIRFSHRGCELQAVNTHRQACCSIELDSIRFQDLVFDVDDGHNGMIEYFVNISELLEPLQPFKDDSKFYIKIEAKDDTEFTVQVFYTEGAVGTRCRKRCHEERQSAKKKRFKLPHHGKAPADVNDAIISPPSSDRDRTRSRHKHSGQEQDDDGQCEPKYERDYTSKVKTLTYTVSSNRKSATHSHYLNLRETPDPAANIISFSMDAASLNVLFRESSVMEEKVCMMAYPRRKEIGFYTGGERGELFDRLSTKTADNTCGAVNDDRCLDNDEIAGLDIIWNTPPTPSASCTTITTTNSVSDDGVVREQYSNRLIKAFGKVMNAPHRIRCSFSPGRPLVMEVAHSHMRIVAHIVPWSAEWARISSPPSTRGKHVEKSARTSASQSTQSKEFIQTSPAQFVMQRPGKRSLILSELYQGNKASPPLHEISLFDRQILREGVHERMVRLHLPLPMIPQFWQRHEYCSDDVRKTLRCYRTPVWHLNLLLHLPIATTAVKISHEHRDGLTYGGRQASVDQLMLHFKKANMYTGSALNSSAWSKNSSLKYSKCTHKPPLSVHSVKVHDWRELVDIYQRRIEMKYSDDKKTRGDHEGSENTTFQCEFLRFPAYRYHATWDWKDIEVIPVQWHKQAELMDLVRVVPENFYFEQLPYPTCAIQSLPRFMVKQKMYVQTLESLYVSDPTKKSQKTSTKR